MTGAAFLSRYRALAAATWVFPPVIGMAFEMFLGLLTPEQIFKTILLGFTGPYIVGFAVFATLWLDRRARALMALVEALPEVPETRERIGAAASRLMLLQLGLFLLYCLAGPQTTLLTYRLHGEAFPTTSWFSLLVGNVPPILLIALPLYFLVGDTLGRYLAPHGVILNLVSLKHKLGVLGLVAPALVDVTLILYFYERTGFFGLEALFVWSALLVVAGLCAALAWRSLKQGLAPLKHATAPNTDWLHAFVLPQSLDELGLLARDWNVAVDNVRQQEMRFRDLVEGSIQGISVHRDFRLLFANQAMADILGVETPADVLAHSSALDFVHPEDRPRMINLKEARLAGEEAPDRYIFRALRKDGSTLWAESIVRVVNWDGAPAIQATIIDVTERVMAEEALRRSEESLTNAQRIARLGNWDWDIVNGTLHWSDEIYRVFGTEPHAFPATYETFLDRVHPDDRKAVTDAVDKALAGEAPYTIDHRIVLLDGRIRVVHEQAEVILDDLGQPVGMHGTVQDITERRAAEEEIHRLNADLERRVEERTRELREAQAELIKKDRLATLGQLTATVSHELRNPLGTMQTSVYVLSTDYPPTSQRAREALDRIERGIQRCDRIVDELLNFTRSANIDRTPVVIDSWLAEILSEQQIPPGITLRTELKLDGLVAMIDPGRLRRAVVNLVENASQAVTGQDGWEESTGGRVTVATSRSGDNLEISVSDSGPGIPADIREKIFEPLFSTKSFGVGLGLPTVRQIIEQHGGTVAVESDRGGGTTFRLVFRLETPNSPARPVHEQRVILKD